jgi:hypothetical protein
MDAANLHGLVERYAYGTVLWLVLFIIPYSIVRFLAYKKALGPDSFIYKPIRFRVCQRVPGFAHAVIMSYLGWKDFADNGYQFTVLSPNTGSQEFIIDLSLTYLIVDTLMDVFRGPELMYFFHHFFLIVSFYYCRFHVLSSGGMVRTLYLR